MSANTKQLIAKIQSRAQKNAAKKTDKLERALAASRIVQLSLQEFMNVTGIKMDKYLVDKFYHSIKEDIPIYLDNELIQWCGYAGELRDQKRRLFDLIKKYKVSTIDLDNDEYEELREVNLIYYPKVDKSRGKGKTRHILIMPDDFQLIVLRLPTSTGHIVADHYIGLSNLVRLYWQYQAAFYKINFEDLINQTCNEPRNIIYSRHQKIKQLEINLQQRYRIGCIYFIYEDDDLDYFKIGWCYNLPNRLTSLQTSNRRELKIYKSVICQYPEQQEKYLHKQFSKYRICGEWFCGISIFYIDNIGINTCYIDMV